MCLNLSRDLVRVVVTDFDLAEIIPVTRCADTCRGQVWEIELERNGALETSKYHADDPCFACINARLGDISDPFTQNSPNVFQGSQARAE